MTDVNNPHDQKKPDGNCPIIVMGGGPAGVFTACGLVELGLPVTLFTRPRPFPAWEGLSDRPLNSLRHFGFTETVASVGPMVARMSHWNGVSQMQNREYILNRQLFDEALLKDAKRKGVEVISGRIEKAEPISINSKGSSPTKGWRVSYSTSEGPNRLDTGFLVEARGRESKIGRQQNDRQPMGMVGEKNSPSGVSPFVTGPATSALLKTYRVPEAYEAMTSVASFDMGWAWHLRDGKGTAILQLFVSSEKGELPSKSGLEAYFTKLTSRLPETEEWLKNAEPMNDHVSVRTAAAQKLSTIGGDDFLVVGDGSLALDPLSGNGIFYAIGSGLAAAPVINSLIHRPEDKAVALQFFQERIELGFKGGCLMGREFYASEGRFPEYDFWQARAQWPEGEEVSHPDPLSVPAVVCDKPVVKQGFIAAEKVIVTADHPRGVWQIDGVPLVALMGRIKNGESSDEENAKVFGVGKQEIVTARGWLAARKLL